MAEWLCCSKKKCLPNHKCCGLGFYFPCYILFLTCKRPKSSPCVVPTKSLLYGDYIGSPSGLLEDSLGTGRTSAKLGLIYKGVLGDSSKTPQRLSGLLGDYLGTLQQCVAQCNNLHWLTRYWVVTFPITNNENPILQLEAYRHCFCQSTATTTSMTNSNSNNKENYFDLYLEINIPLIDGVTHDKTIVSLKK